MTDTNWDVSASEETLDEMKQNKLNIILYFQIILQLLETDKAQSPQYKLAENMLNYVIQFEILLQIHF